MLASGPLVGLTVAHCICEDVEDGHALWLPSCVLIIKALCSCSVPQSCLTLRPRGLQPTRLLCLWGFLGKNTGVGCHFLLQGIFSTQGSNPRLLRLLHWHVDSLLLGHLGGLWLPRLGYLKAEGPQAPPWWVSFTQGSGGATTWQISRPSALRRSPICPGAKPSC